MANQIVKVDIPDIDYVRKQLGDFPDAAKKILKKTINQVTRELVKKDMPEVASSDYEGNKSNMKSVIAGNRSKEGSVQVKNASNKLGQVVLVSGEKLALTKFKVTPKTPKSQKGIQVYKRPLSPLVKVQRSNPAVRLAGKKITVAAAKKKYGKKQRQETSMEKANTFLAQMLTSEGEGSGHIGIFREIPGKTKRGNNKIQEVVGLSVAEMVGNKRNMAKIDTEVRRKIYNKLRENIAAYLEKQQGVSEDGN